jgi:beta-glucosidase
VEHCVVAMVHRSSPGRASSALDPERASGTRPPAAGRRFASAPRLAVVVCTIGLLLAWAPPAAAARTPRTVRRALKVSGPPDCPWLNSSLPVPVRVRMLLSAMTPRQEADMMHLEWGSGTADPYEGQSAAIPALCIPLITEDDGAAGVGSGWHHGSLRTSPLAFTGATQLPAPIADAAAFDPGLARRYGQVIGTEDAASGVDVALAPTINIERDPLWGRAYESLGEDPYLSATLGIALVDGIQSKRVVAVLKHLAAYNQETHRGTLSDDAIMSARTLREVYLPAFSAVVQQARPGGIMCSYALINGVPSCQNVALLQGILRDEWRFTGFVRSDCGSVFDQTAALAAGVSQVKCGTTYEPAHLVRDLKLGVLSRAALDAVVAPLLTTLFTQNLIASPHPPHPYGEVSTAADRAVARRTDDEGAVLLKNDGILPLDLARIPSLALIGGHDGTPMPAGLGAMHVRDATPDTTLDALRAALGSRLTYASGSDPAQAARVAGKAAVAVVVVHDTEIEGYDRKNLTLPDHQDRLVRAVEAVNHHTIVVLETGAPVLLPWLAATPALLETWYPGQQAGPSLVDLLSGAVDPGGKLPVTWPASATARPDVSPADFGGVRGRVDYQADGIDVGYRWYQVHHVTPAFSFGDGLSYTSFSFSDLDVRTARDGDLEVAATVTDTGHRAGSDVVQCYVGQPPTAGEPPRQLRGFQRVRLRPGGSATVHLELTPGDLAHWSTLAGQWERSAGRYRIWVGDGSDLAHLPLSATVTEPALALGVDSGPAPVPASQA